MTHPTRDHNRVTPEGKAMGEQMARLAEPIIQRMADLGEPDAHGIGATAAPAPSVVEAQVEQQPSEAATERKEFRPAKIRACPIPVPRPDRTLYGPNRTVDGHYFSAATLRLHGQRAYAAGLADAQSEGDATQSPAAAVTRDLDDDDMDAVATAVAGLGKGEIGFHAFCDRIARIAAAHSPNTEGGGA
jgi:hypothetical protein